MQSLPLRPSSLSHNTVCFQQCLAVGNAERLTIEDIISRCYSPSHSCQKHIYFGVLFLPRLTKFISEYLKHAFASISQIVFHLAYHIDKVYRSWACPLQPLLLGYVGSKSTESQKTAPKPLLLKLAWNIRKMIFNFFLQFNYSVYTKQVGKQSPEKTPNTFEFSKCTLYPTYDLGHNGPTPFSLQ